MLNILEPTGISSSRRQVGLVGTDLERSLYTKACEGHPKVVFQDCYNTCDNHVLLEYGDSVKYLLFSPFQPKILISRELIETVKLELMSNEIISDLVKEAIEKTSSKLNNFFLCSRILVIRSVSLVLVLV